MTATELDDVAHRIEAQGGLTDAGCEPVVLLAHPDAAARAELSRHLAGRGFRVYPAGTAAEALWEGLEHAGSVDALICDPDLPGLPAAELFGRLRLTIPWLRLCVLAAAPVAATS